jgi:hypothetical protein
VSMPEDRVNPAMQGGDAAVSQARADREVRLAHDEAQLRLPPSEQPHGREVLSHYQGLPTVQEQMVTHGAAPPKVPDTGGHDSPSAHIG